VEADLKRAQDSIKNHTNSPQEFDSAQAAAKAAGASFKAAQEEEASNRAEVVEAQPQVEAARKYFRARRSG
jgi:multidrug resistance efflux pump